MCDVDEAVVGTGDIPSSIACTEGSPFSYRVSHFIVNEMSVRRKMVKTGNPAKGRMDRVSSPTYMKGMEKEGCLC